MAAEDLEVLPFDEVPVGRDLLLLGTGEQPLLEKRWEQFLALSDKSDATYPHDMLDWHWSFVEQRGADYLDVNIGIDNVHRFHGVVRRLPRSKFRTCLHYWNWQKRPYLIVEQDWLDAISTNLFSSFALVDAIGMKSFLEREGYLESGRVDAFREDLDRIAKEHGDHVFFSFADSVLVKTNWTATRPGYTDSFRPELLLRVLNRIRSAFSDAFGLDAYAVVTQGANYYPDASPVRVSGSGNHIFLGSLGTPFAQLFEIDDAVRLALREKKHAPKQLYMAHWFFLTLKIKYDTREQFQRQLTPYHGRTTGSEQNSYLAVNFDDVLAALDSER